MWGGIRLPNIYHLHRLLLLLMRTLTFTIDPGGRRAAHVSVAVFQHVRRSDPCFQIQPKYPISVSVSVDTFRSRWLVGWCAMPTAENVLIYFGFCLFISRSFHHINHHPSSKKQG